MTPGCGPCSGYESRELLGNQRATISPIIFKVCHSQTDGSVTWFICIRVAVGIETGAASLVDALASHVAFETLVSGSAFATSL
jgi:hypothetical protein